MKEIYQLVFPKDVVEKNVIYKLIKNYKLKVNILKASINAGQEGSLLAEFEYAKEDFHLALIYLKTLDIKLQTIAKKIFFKTEECIDCGSCTAVCFKDCLKLDKEKKLQSNFSNCIGCELCVKACPLGLLSFI